MFFHSSHTLLAPASITTIALIEFLFTSCDKSPSVSPEHSQRPTAEAVQNAASETTARVNQERIAAEEREKVEKQNEADKRRLKSAQQAIKNHLTQLEIVIKRIKSTPPADPAEARKLMRDTYEAAVAIPTYDCPEDYRKAYQHFLERLEQMVNILESVPKDGFEQLLEVIKDGQNGTLGGSERSRQSSIDAANRHFQESLQELGAVVNRYGITKF